MRINLTSDQIKTENSLIKTGGVLMKLSNQIKPVSYIKVNVAEVVKNLTIKKEPIIITQNGEAKVVIQDIKSYEKTQEMLAMLKILALGNKQIEDGQVQPASQVIKRIRHNKKA